MNYDLMTWLEYFVGAFAGTLGFYFIARIILSKTTKNKMINDLIKMIVLTIFTIANSLIFNNIAKLFGSALIVFSVYYFIYKEKYNKSVTLTFFTFVLTMLSEATFALISSLLVLIFKMDIMSEVIVKSYIINILIPITSVCYAYIFRKRIRKLNESIKEKNVLYIIILGIIVVLIGFSAIYNLFLDKLIINYEFILNIIIVVGCSILTLILIKQYLKNKEITDKYLLLEDYLKTSAELIEKYSSTVHKYKNNLIILKGYINLNEKEANKYLDSLLNNYQMKEYNWISKLNYINIETLKYLIYYKLSKAEESNLKIIVLVSKEIKHIAKDIFKISELGLILDTLGEYFDNAIYASKESKEKELVFDLHLEENQLVFAISNTYKEKVDISMISKNGYTTKGKGHGLGLYDIEKVIKSSKFLNCKYELIDNYFVITLYAKYI